ncbi:efflux RND transporter periplasmic adaptor subunit [Tundrisphaera lichenicola]|uniref:efflux RND transporter periplasmic adaptor subunit n=1 Tax=Tundrisphaera lichenicola TaxID=2029860 RepID=UPI003EBED8B0
MSSTESAPIDTTSRTLAPRSKKSAILAGFATLLVVSCVVLAFWFSRNRDAAIADSNPSIARTPAATETKPSSEPGEKAPSEILHVEMSEDQQRSIGLETRKVILGNAPRMTNAPGRVAPNENQYAFITPRAAGVVRTVNAHIGQEVKAGDLLATIDSPEVGEARLDLYTKLQTLEIARSQAIWEETVYGNTIELLDLLRKQETPEEVHKSLEDRAVGMNREKLMTAYAEFLLARATLDRNTDLYSQKLITPKDFERVKASYDVAQATYQSLMDEMGYEVKLENTRAQQALKQAETAVRAARERLRILGVRPDGTEPPIQGGKVVGVDPDGTLAHQPSEGAPGQVDPQAILPQPTSTASASVAPVGAGPEQALIGAEAPVSTYSIWAPFDGTILDREMIVPGVAVDKQHRIFTMANLNTVWVEASVHEGDFAMLDLVRKRGGTLRFHSPAYPDRIFEGKVNYTGDLVEEQSRTVKLLAKAENPDRYLRPGMFVEVEVQSPRGKEALEVPTAALLIDGSRTYVYVRTGPDSFERREVKAEAPRDDRVTIQDGLADGDEVVIKGAFKLKALAKNFLASEE